MKETASKIVSLLGSRQFFYGVLIFFALESLWIALSAVYPMAFDEDFHYGIISIYAEQWSPFLSGQPENAGRLGALAADPSYLFHYLMSFPYRLIQAFTDNQATTVILLRLLNIAMAVGAVYLFRRVLLRVGMSQAFTHTALALFVLIPIVSVVAGQINYDNAAMLLLAAMCLLTFTAYESLRKQRVEVRAIALLAVVCMVASLVKYAFLPFAAAAVLFLVVAACMSFRGRFASLWPAVQRGYGAVSLRGRIALVVLVGLVLGLFLQRYGLNTLRYHTPIPSCEVALSVNECLEYGPWVRNFGLSIVKDEFNTSPFAYTWQWMQSLHYRMFFAVNGPSDSYRNYPPLPLPSGTIVALAVSGTVALLLYGRRALRGRPLLSFLLGMSVLYIGVLWVEDYSQFLETGQPVAINGRYLLPVLLPMAAVFGVLFREAFLNSQRLKAVAATAAILLFLHGGGVFTFIARSDPAWYWPHKTIRQINEGAERLLLPVLFEGNKYYF